MEEIIIRNAIVNDIPNIALLLREIGWFEQVKKWSIKETEESIKAQFYRIQHDHTHFLLIAEKTNKEFLGYCMVHLNMHLFLPGPEAFISDLFIREKCRGQSIGRKFIDAVKQLAIENHCGRIGLLNNRDRESYQRSFYAKMGFTERPNMADFVLLLK